jgi:hypothetical protein
MYYYAKVFLDEDIPGVRYIHVIEDMGNFARHIAWISTQGRNIYKCVRRRVPIVDRQQDSYIRVRDRTCIDNTPERLDENPVEPTYERLEMCFARLGLNPELEATLRRITIDRRIPATPARYFIVSLTERERERVARARVSW